MTGATETSRANRHGRHVCGSMSPWTTKCLMAPRCTHWCTPGASV